MNYKKLGAEIGELVVQKQAAYGDSFGKSGEVMEILYPNGISAEQMTDALAVVRVLDKLFRIATMPDAFGESPWKDIAGYALLGASRSLGELAKQTLPPADDVPGLGVPYNGYDPLLDPIEKENEAKGLCWCGKPDGHDLDSYEEFDQPERDALGYDANGSPTLDELGKDDVGADYTRGLDEYVDSLPCDCAYYPCAHDGDDVWEACRGDEIGFGGMWPDRDDK